MKLTNRTFQDKRNTEKKTSETLKNATSVIFFKNQTHHKHTDDFKESKFSVINQKTEIPQLSGLTLNKGISQTTNLINNEILPSWAASAHEIKTPSQFEFEGTGFYGDNVLNLEEYKAYCYSMEEFIGIMYNHLLTDLIPATKTNHSGSIIKSMSIERTMKAARNLSKEMKSEVIINQTKSRIDLIFNYGFYKLDTFFKGKDYRHEIGIFMNLQVKILLAMWIVLEMVEDEKEIVHLLADIFTELFQCGLAITKLLLKRLNKEHKNNEIYARLEQSVLYLIVPPKDKQEAEYFNSINKLIANMLGIFIMNIIQKISSTQNLPTEYQSTYSLIKLSNNNYYIGLLMDLVKNMNNRSDAFISDLLGKLKADEMGGSQLRNQDIMVKPKFPFLPPTKKNTDKSYTLVLDLDETLIHYCGKVTN